jgi:GNAT superfamily N-acetyltransferase
MRDLLVPLYDLPDRPEPPDDVMVDRPAACCASGLLEIIGGEFGSGWRSEAGVCILRTPPTMVAAFDTADGQPLGFCCWDAAALGFLGPVGVFDGHRGKGLGRVLVLSCLHRMRQQGYGYAVVGGAGPEGFFESVCDARPIAGSSGSVYPPWVPGRDSDS